MKDEIYRLKVKCNSYAKRLVTLGENDVSWEVTGNLALQNTKESQPANSEAGQVGEAPPTVESAPCEHRHTHVEKITSGAICDDCGEEL